MNSLRVVQIAAASVAHGPCTEHLLSTLIVTNTFSGTQLYDFKNSRTFFISKL